MVGLDGQQLKGGATYEILPGDHMVAVVGQQLQYRVLYNVVRTSAPTSLCFKARAGRAYLVERELSGDGHWETFLTDEDSGLAPEGVDGRAGGLRVVDSAPGGEHRRSLHVGALHGACHGCSPEAGR